MSSIDEILREGARLKAEIREAISRHGPGRVHAIDLGCGWDVVDISANIDVDVTLNDGSEREFTFVTLAALERFLSDREVPHFMENDFYTTGGPFIVVRHLSADVIARGILKFLDMEAAPNGDAV